MEKKIDRRAFLTGVVGAGAITAFCAATGCAPQNTTTDPDSAADVAATTDDWLGEPPAVTDADCVEIIDTEVLVVGAGCSGTFAACHALEAGAKVTLIEANASGVGIRSSALGAIGSKYQKEKGIEINKEDILNDMTHYALNQCDMSLYRNWADNSAEAIDWYGSLAEDAGFEIALEYNMPEETRYKCWPTGHGTAQKGGQGGGDEQAVHKFILDKYTDEGLDYRTETKMLCLIKEGARVAGLYATNPDGDNIRINASRGVIIATGGYVDNEEMYTALQGELKKSLCGFLTFGTAHGDGIKACLWAGASKDAFCTTMIFDRGIVEPSTELKGPWETGKYAYFHIATQPFLKVTKSGKRICNESSPYDFVVHSAARMEGRAWYPIWDSTWREDVTRFFTVGCSTLFPREGGNHHSEGLDMVEADIDGHVEDGMVVKADTLEDLAAGLGLTDIELFKSEIERYNGWFTAQYDGEFGKDPFRLSAIDTPPYYGAKIGGLPLCTLDGISVNARYQALDDELKPIEGLYVIGNDSGNYYVNTYPNLGAGTNAGRSATAGMLCGRIVAAS